MLKKKQNLRNVRKGEKISDSKIISVIYKDIPVEIYQDTLYEGL